MQDLSQALHLGINLGELTEAILFSQDDLSLLIGRLLTLEEREFLITHLSA